MAINVKFASCIMRIFWILGIKPNSMDSAKRGKYGEWLGERHLRRKGFQINYRNWRCKIDKRLEIDLVCENENVLIFVEVRARSEDSLVTGYDSITFKKRKALGKSIRSYLKEKKPSNRTHRLDLIEIDLPSRSKAKPKIFHHENIAIS